MYKARLSARQSRIQDDTIEPTSNTSELPDIQKEFDLTSVSIVVPVYNEESSISEFIRRLSAVADTLFEKYQFEFVLVNDGSKDGSLERIKMAMATEPRLNVIELRRNYGQTAALQAGLDFASGDLIITMDSDLQHFPEDIPIFIEKIGKSYDVICGWRHQREEGIVRRWPSMIANILLRKLSGIEIHDFGTTFRIYRREIISEMQLLGENHRFIPIFAKAAGARIGELPISNIVRPSGKSNYGLMRTFNVFVDLFFLYFFTYYLDRPIRIFGKLALIAFTLASAIAIYLAVVWIMQDLPVVRVHSGWFLLSIMLFLSAIQFILGGISCEVLARIYYSSMQTTTYKVRCIHYGKNKDVHISKK